MFSTEEKHSPPDDAANGGVEAKGVHGHDRRQLLDVHLEAKKKKRIQRVEKESQRGTRSEKRARGVIRVVICGKHGAPKRTKTRKTANGKR